MTLKNTAKQDFFSLGTIKGIGSIYSQAVIDCNSSFAFAKLYNRKGAAPAIDIIGTRNKRGERF